MKIFFFKKYTVKRTRQSTHVIFFSDTLVRTTLGEFTHSEFHEKHELNDSERYRQGRKFNLKIKT